MKRDEVLVEGVRSISTKVEGKAARARSGSRAAQVAVTFSGGVVGLLDARDAREKTWAEVLGSLRATRQPAYVEVDSKTRRIKNLLLPYRSVVLDLREISRAGDLQVELEQSHAAHFLLRQSEKFEEFRALLENARRSRQAVLLTDSLDGSSIIDVRPTT